MSIVARIRCRLLGHWWRPDRYHLFGVCRRCGTAKREPHPFQLGKPDKEGRL